MHYHTHLQTIIRNIRPIPSAKSLGRIIVLIDRTRQVRRTHGRNHIPAAVIGHLGPKPFQVFGVGAEGFGNAVHPLGAYVLGYTSGTGDGVSVYFCMAKV